MNDDERLNLANDLGNALTLMQPGYLIKSLNECTPEELEVVNRIVQRAQLIRSASQVDAFGRLESRW